MGDGNKKICLLYTTYHSFLWDVICKKSNHSDILVVNFSTRVLDGKGFDKIERAERGKIYFFFLCIAIALKAKFVDYELILPHPDHLLGNVLFFNKRVKKITLIEDGILNYYNYERRDFVNFVSNRRRKITRFTPFRYYLYKGHHSGVDDCRSVELAGWFTDPCNVVRREKFSEINKIEFPSIQKNGGGKRAVVLFLDQPIEKFLTIALAEKIRKRSIVFLEENFSEVLVKSHPEHEAVNFVIKNQKKFDFQPGKPVEELISEMQPDVVVSYCSTALINISKISPEIQCISIGMEEMMVAVPSLVKIKYLFDVNGIKAV